MNNIIAKTISFTNVEANFNSDSDAKSINPILQIFHRLTHKTWKKNETVNEQKETNSTQTEQRTAHETWQNWFFFHNSDIWAVLTNTRTSHANDFFYDKSWIQYDKHIAFQRFHWQKKKLIFFKPWMEIGYGYAYTIYLKLQTTNLPHNLKLNLKNIIKGPNVSRLNLTKIAIHGIIQQTIRMHLWYDNILKMKNQKHTAWNYIKPCSKVPEMKYEFCHRFERIFRTQV